MNQNNFSKYVKGEGLKQAKLARLFAKFLDLTLALFISYLLGPIGVLLGVGYLIYMDSLKEGQSLGKRVVGMKVIGIEDGQPCNLKQSAIRNIFFWAPLLFNIIPLWGQILFFVLFVPSVLFELYLLLFLDSGKRLGDVLADTTVLAGTPPIGVRVDESSSWYPEGIS